MKTTGFAVIGGGGATRTGSAAVAFDGKAFVGIPRHRSNEKVRVWFPIQGPHHFVLRIYVNRVEEIIDLVLPDDNVLPITCGVEANDRFGERFRIPPPHLIDAAIQCARNLARSYHDRGDYDSSTMNRLADAASYEEVLNAKA